MIYAIKNGSRGEGGARVGIHVEEKDVSLAVDEAGGKGGFEIERTDHRRVQHAACIRIARRRMRRRTTRIAS